jgi:protein phosphatase
MTDQTTPNSVASAQLIGDRDNQQDTLAVQPLAADMGTHAGELLLVLADGMGGYAGGDVASQLVVRHFSEAYSEIAANIPEALGSSLNIANEQLANAVVETPKLKGMGTTLIGCVVSKNHLYWISVGDSPLWIYRDGVLQQLNADHSMVPLLDDMVRTGIMNEEEALTDYRRNSLRSAVMGEIIELVDLRKQPYPLQTDDIVILASDGVETLAEGELAAVLGNLADKSLQTLADKLMASIKAVGHSGQDNASVILYRH